MQLPADKQVTTLTSAMVLQRCAARAIPVPEFALAQLGGRLVWWSQVDPMLACNIRPLLTWSHWSAFGRPALWRRAAHYWSGAAAPEQAAALGWFCSRAAAGHLTGSALLHQQRPVLVSTSDGSGSANAVSLLHEGALLRWVLPACGGVAIPVLEVLALILYVWRYRDVLKGCTLRHGFDALGAAYWVSAGKARRDDGNDLMRLLRLACERYDIVLVVQWLTRWYNLTADHGADFPLATLQARGVPVPPILREATLAGLPCDFLADWARELDPLFVFSPAWQVRNDRGSQ